MATSITKKPNKTVTNLGAPVRQSGNRVMKTTWKVPNDMIKESSNARATDLRLTWVLDIPGKDPKQVTITKNERTTTSSINLDSCKIGSATYTRSSFYPLHGSRFLYGVTMSVEGKNSKGYGKKVSVRRSFSPPRAPSISAWSFDSETGAVSATITTDAGTDYCERYDTRYWVEVYQSWNGQRWNHINTSSTSTSIGVSYNPGGYQSLGFRDYIRVTVGAYARGYAGNSGTVAQTFYIAYPGQAVLGEPSVTGKTGTDKCIIPVNTNHSADHPVDRVKLEYLADVTYATAADIPASESWTDSGIMDDYNCTALTMPVANLMPSRGKHTWVRAKTYHASEAVLVRYSEYREVKDLFVPVPTAADDDIVILSATAGADGKSAVVHLGWNADGEDDSTGTELTWADEEDTWKSTKNPNEHNFTWSDGEYVDGQTTYHDSATITIKDLVEGEKYYIRARRYLEDEVTTYSPYSNTATVITSEKPEAVVASCASYIPKGKSLPIYWTFSGNGLQTEWQIVDTEGTVLEHGEGSYGSAQISPERLEAFAEDGVISFIVQASTGSGFVSSEVHTVQIVNEPTLDVTVDPTLTVQPFSFDAEVDTLCDLMILVTSQGSVGQKPEGVERQTAGDTIYSDMVTPDWTSSEDTWTATVTIPSGLDFWDLGSYTLSVQAKDMATGLMSGIIEKQFDVAWAHQAPNPEEAVTLTPIDTTDEQGFHRLAVQIELTPPEDSAETDVYDIYRLTGDGAVLIGEGFPLTHITADEYAPFGEDLEYRIAVRTVDGDVDFADIPYVQKCDNLRFDWTGGFLELPYDLSIGDTYKKDVEIRKHMDGSNDGYWNQNISRTAKLNTDVVKLIQKEDIEQARALARYTGPVFVRTPEGSAYEADVQVTDLSADNKAIMKVAFDVTEIGLTREFSLPVPFELEEESES